MPHSGGNSPIKLWIEFMENFHMKNTISMLSFCGEKVPFQNNKNRECNIKIGGKSIQIPWYDAAAADQFTPKLSKITKIVCLCVISFLSFISFGKTL